MKSEFTINGKEIKRPSSFKIEKYNVTNLQRLMNGEMAGDLIAQKRKFFFTYDVISSKDLELIESLTIDDKGIFFDLGYVENGESKTAKVYVGAFPKEFFRSGNVWYWRNVNFNLIEK